MITHADLADTADFFTTEPKVTVSEGRESKCRKYFGNNIAVGMNPEGVVISQAGVERSETPAIVAILYMNPERVAE